MPDTAHGAVRYTTLLLLGELSEWIDRNPSVIEPVLSCVLQSIRSPSLSVAASNSLEAICSTCREHLTPHFSTLLQVVEALVTLPITSELAVKVVKGVTKVSNRLPPDQITNAVHELCKIHVDELTRISQASSTLTSIIIKHIFFTVSRQPILNYTYSFWEPASFYQSITFIDISCIGNWCKSQFSYLALVANGQKILKCNNASSYM